MVKKKLLTITSNDLTISYGPAIHYLELWNEFNSLYEKEFDVLGVAPRWSNSQAPVVKPGFNISFISVPNVRILRQVYYDLFVAWAILRNRKAIIYLRDGGFRLFSILTIKLLRLQYFYELNGFAPMDETSNGSNPFSSRLRCWFQTQLIRGGRCIAVSTGLQSIAESLGATSVTTIENGVSGDFLNLEQNALNEKIKVVYVGTFTSWDGAKRIPDLARSFTAIEFHMIGDGLLRQSVQSESPSNVIFHGFVPYSKLKTAYSNFDIGIVLYESERNKMGISSLKTLEYVASGLPVFSTNVPGQDFIEKEGVGFLTELDDINHRFSDLLRNLPKVKMGVSNFRSTKGVKISWERVARQTRSFLGV